MRVTAGNRDSQKKHRHEHPVNGFSVATASLVTGFILSDLQTCQTSGLNSGPHESHTTGTTISRFMAQFVDRYPQYHSQHPLGWRAGIRSRASPTWFSGARIISILRDWPLQRKLAREIRDLMGCCLDGSNSSNHSRDRETWIPRYK
jgi:hypothetical protein